MKQKNIYFSHEIIQKLKYSKGHFQTTGWSSKSHTYRKKATQVWMEMVTVMFGCSKRQFVDQKAADFCV